MIKEHQVPRVSMVYQAFQDPWAHRAHQVPLENEASLECQVVTDNPAYQECQE